MSTRSPETDAVFERRPATALDQPSRLQLVLAAGHAAETGVQVGKKTTGKDMAPNAKEIEKAREALERRNRFQREAEEKRAKKENEKIAKKNAAKDKKDARIRELQDKKLKKTITLKERAELKLLAGVTADSYDFDLDDEDYVPF